MTASYIQPIRSTAPLATRSGRRRSPKAVRRARTLTVLFFLVALAALVFFPRLVHTQAHQVMVPGIHHTVLVGDTLWEIAEQHAGNRDVREVIYQIEKLNGLSAAPIQPGQVLFVPTAPGTSTAGR